MKKVIIGFICVTIIFGILMFVINTYKKQEDTYVYVITESHYVLTDLTNKMAFTYFTNNKNFSFIDENTYGIMINEDDTIRFPIDSFEVEDTHDEYLNGELLYGFKIWFQLPEITTSYYFKEFYLKFISIDKKVQIYLGDLYVEYEETSNQFFKWNKLNGTKKDTPQISQILVGVPYEQAIEEIYIGPHRVDYFYADKQLVIKAPDDVFVFLNTYVKVVTEEGITYLPQMPYIINYELLSKGLYHKYMY